MCGQVAVDTPQMQWHCGTLPRRNGTSHPKAVFEGDDMLGPATPQNAVTEVI